MSDESRGCAVGSAISAITALATAAARTRRGCMARRLCDETARDVYCLFVARSRLSPRRFDVAEFSSHTPGTFSWPELSTSDQKGAVAFYRALFGWDLNEQPIGPTEMYSMFQMRGKEVAAAYTMRPEEKQSG